MMGLEHTLIVPPTFYLRLNNQYPISYCLQGKGLEHTLTPFLIAPPIFYCQLDNQYSITYCLQEK